MYIRFNAPSEREQRNGKIQEYASSLRSNTITSINLWGVGFQATDASVLGAALKSNHSLTSLELGSNPALGDAGVRALAAGLREAHGLVTLLAVLSFVWMLDSHPEVSCGFFLRV